MPDRIATLMNRVRARLCARVIAQAATVGGAVLAVLLIIGASDAVAVVVALLAALVVAEREWRISPTAVARVVERHHPMDNLLVTAAELEERPRPVPPEIGDAIGQQAADRASNVQPGDVVPLMQPMTVAAAVIAGCILLIRMGDVPDAVQQALRNSAEAPHANNAISVIVTPPSYTRRPAENFDNPTQVSVMAGSTVRVEARSRVVRDWIAKESESLELRVHEGAPPRFLSVVVIPDAPPTVRVTEPGRDTAIAEPRGSLRLGVESRDDVGVASLVLRYTKASGGGENVTFTDGEVPMRLERVSERHWRASAQWTIDALDLADGDVLVYRAIARDINPGGVAVESDAYLIEIGRAAEIASAGFALPTDEKKYAISQQMVIYKTEQLISNRAKHPNDWLEQTRMLGMEQRMVRAEVVFLSGGEVQDEVEEAAHSHELAEGRLENQGRAEMVRALNFMSRAEAQLNNGNAAEALVFERQALASLERALDRRRYFLRTLPDRSRIDMTRRLTGERRDARAWLRPRSEAAVNETTRLRTAMRDLLAALNDRATMNASLAARVAAVAPASPDLQKAAVAIANAETPEEQRQAAHAAMAALTAHALGTLPASTAVAIPTDPLAGALQESMKGRPR